MLCVQLLCEKLDTAWDSIILSEFITFLRTWTSERSAEPVLLKVNSEPVCFGPTLEMVEGKFWEKLENICLSKWPMFSWNNTTGADMIIKAHLGWIGKWFIPLHCPVLPFFRCCGESHAAVTQFPDQWRPVCHNLIHTVGTLLQHDLLEQLQEDHFGQSVLVFIQERAAYVVFIMQFTEPWSCPCIIKKQNISNKTIRIVTMMFTIIIITTMCMYTLYYITITIFPLRKHQKIRSR